MKEFYFLIHLRTRRNANPSKNDRQSSYPRARSRPMTAIHHYGNHVDWTDWAHRSGSPVRWWRLPYLLMQLSARSGLSLLNSILTRWCRKWKERVRIFNSDTAFADVPEREAYFIVLSRSRDGTLVCWMVKGEWKRPTQIHLGSHFSVIRRDNEHLRAQL